MRFDNKNSFISSNDKSDLNVALRSGLGPALCLIYAAALTRSEAAKAAVIDQDTLETAVAAPVDLVAQGDFFYVFAAEKFSYDDNVYRLSPNVTDLDTLDGVGPHPSRQDHIDTVSAGLDGQWSKGRQTVVVDLDVDDNRFNINSNLNNVSSNDKVIWDWNFAGLLTGQAGATYSSGLGGFVNATVYSRDIIDSTNYFGSARYQLGPHWAVFGGILGSSTTLSAPGAQGNDSHTKSVEFGAEYVTSLKNTLGMGYRYTDDRYPPTLTGNGDFREDIAYFYLKHAFSVKTSIDGSAGYLERDYASTSIDSYSGIIWSLSLQWKPTEKFQIKADAWRRLEAYLTAQSDYFVSIGGSVAPGWAASEKVTLSLNWSLEDQNYVNRLGADEISTQSRRDTLDVGQVNIAYTPVRFLLLNFAYGYEKRNSNISNFSYEDLLASAKVILKF